MSVGVSVCFVKVVYILSGFTPVLYHAVVTDMYSLYNL